MTLAFSMTIDGVYRTRLVNILRAVIDEWQTSSLIVSKHTIMSCEMMGEGLYRISGLDKCLALSVTLIVSTMVYGCQLGALPSNDTVFDDDDSWYLVIPP